MFELSNIYDDEPRTISIGKAKLPWPFPVAYGLGSSSARVFGRPVFGSGKPFWLMPTFRVFKKARDLHWEIQHRYNPRHIHHLVNTGLRPGYYDVDTLMLYSVMALVCRYVEREHDGEEALEKWAQELVDHPADPDHEPYEGATQAQGKKELGVLDIYKWWKHQKPKDEARRDELLTRLYGRGRMTWAPTDHPKLSQAVFKPFEGEEIALEKEFRDLEGKIADDEQTYLHRTIDLRRGMWT